jgi:hypothetical protein
LAAAFGRSAAIAAAADGSSSSDSELCTSSACRAHAHACRRGFRARVSWVKAHLLRGDA